MPTSSELEQLQSANLAFAIEEWQSVLGSEYVVTDPGALESAATGTFKTGRRIPVILQPSTREEVQECVRIANRFRIPVYVISTGLNFGYGSRVPTSDSVLMELRRMRRILDYSEELGYVTVEPGVTQAQLYEFLQEHKSRLWIDASGAHPDSSLIGNTLERGFGHTPYGDHFANSCGYEVVLPTGECIGTGFARFANAKNAEAYRWGVGPTLDGIFTQSNFGIVTRMTVYLMPAPEYFQTFYFRCDDDASLPSIINAMRPLRLDGTIKSAMHIVNDYKVMSSMRQYPWEKTGGATPLQPDVMKSFRKDLGCGAWNGSGALYGTRRQVAEARRLIKKALSGRIDKLQFLDDFMLGVASRFAKPLGAVTGWDLSGVLELLKPVYGLMKGIPTEHPLKSCYWRQRSVPATYNLEADGCGLFWCSPIAPSDGAHVATVRDIAYDVILSGGYEPMISVTLLTERSSSCVISMSYDRTVAGEDDKALACYKRLLKTLGEKGYYCYRLSTQGMEHMQGAPVYNSVLQRIKQALDPNQVLSPGHYVPSA